MGIANALVVKLDEREFDSKLSQRQMGERVP